LEDYRLAHSQEQGTPTQLSDHQLAPWSTPVYGWIKINWDAALDWHHNLMGVGLLARDHLGWVIAAMCYSQNINWIWRQQKRSVFGLLLNLLSFRGLFQFRWREMHRRWSGRCNGMMKGATLLEVWFSMLRKSWSLLYLGILVMYREEEIERPISLLNLLVQSSWTRFGLTPILLVSWELYVLSVISLIYNIITSSFQKKKKFNDLIQLR
jgi:hypothetical protein